MIPLVSMGPPLMNNAFDYHAPWVIDEESEIKLRIRDKSLLSSNRLFIRLDLYPFHSPSHPHRHHGYWDLDLNRFGQEEISLILRNGEMHVRRADGECCLQPVWQGKTDFLGYCTLNISLRDACNESSEPLVLKSFQHILRPQKRDLPLQQVSLHTTERCNLRCRMCRRQIGSGVGRDDLSDAVLARVLEACPDICSLILQGIGEPLINKNLCGIAGEFKKRMPISSKVGMYTNATLLTTSTASRLVDAGLDWITFSLDGATKQTLEYIRAGLNFDEVIRNIAYILEYARAERGNDMTFGANFVVMTENLHEIRPFVVLAGSLGLNHITFSPRRDFLTGRMETRDADLLRRLHDEAVEEGRRRGIGVFFPILSEYKKPQCEYLQTVFVWLSGDVVPCCRLLPGDRLRPVRVFGNLKQDSILKI